jgi:hypothetical protein
MSNLPSGMGSFSPGGGYVLPPNRHIPSVGNNFSNGIAQAAGSSTPISVPMSRSRTTRNPYAPFDVTTPLLQTFGIGSQFNPMALFDLMNLGAAPFVSPFAGSGLLGYPGLGFGSGLSAPAGPAVSGQLASAPLPRSGGKGVMG